MRNDYGLDSYLIEKAKASKPAPAPEQFQLDMTKPAVPSGGLSGGGGTYPWHWAKRQIAKKD